MRLLPALLVVASVVSGCDVQVSKGGGVSLDVFEGHAKDEWKRAYTLARGGRFELDNPNGRIQVYPAKGPQIEVVATREVRGAPSDEAAQEILTKQKLKEEVSADRVAIGIEGNGIYEGMLGHRRTMNVNFRVGVPNGLALTLTSDNGSIGIEGVEGRIAVATTNGMITARSVAGPIDGTAVNGSLTIELAAVTGDVKLETVNGTIRLGLPRDANADIEATAVNGGVTLDDLLPVTTTERARLRIAGRLNDGGSKIVVKTTNGGVRLLARDSLRFNADRVPPRPPAPPPPPPSSR